MVSCSINNRALRINALLPAVSRRARLEIRSKRNRPVSRMSDISPLDPNRAPGTERYPQNQDCYFPVVDVQIIPGMYAEARIESGLRECYINAYLDASALEVKEGLVTIPGDRLVEWENGICLHDKKALLADFAIIREIPVLPTVSRRVIAEIELLSTEWEGSVTVCFLNEENRWTCLEQVEVHSSTGVTPVKTCENRVEQFLCDTIGFILRAQNCCAASPHRGGLYLFYDMDAKTYRNGQWPWSWGPAIRLFLDAASVSPEAQKRFGGDFLHATALEIGRTTLRFTVDHPGHVADGFGTTRYTPRQNEPTGYQELINTGSDIGFLVGWGWIPLHKHFPDEGFLAMAERYISAFGWMLEEFPVPPQEWLPATKNWTDFTIDESGFGTEGLAAVYKATGNKEYRNLCRSYMEAHLAVFERPDGLWQRHYSHVTGKVSETSFMTRGTGWAMEGLLAAHRALPEDGRYLAKAVRMADVLVDAQNEDGSWSYEFTRPPEETGRADKGTALWCLLMYMLYGETGTEKYLVSARRALDWCIKAQYNGNDPHAQGGIFAPSPQSGVTYRAWFRLCCQYTSAFAGLAALEELKLQNMGRRA